MVRSPRYCAAALLLFLAACSSSNDADTGNMEDLDTGTTTRPDAQGADAVGSPDAGQPDAAQGDAAQSDAIALDAANPDAVSRDATNPDAMPLPDSGPPTFDVLQHHKNATRDGLYVDPMFTRAMAPMLHQEMGFNATVAGRVYAQPLYFSNGPRGRAILIVVTETNQVTAYDAVDASTVWSVNLGPAIPLGQLPCGNISPTVGITGTPVIDAASRTLYVAAMVSDGGVLKHKIFSVFLEDGSRRNDGGWPVDVAATASYNGVSFASLAQNQRGALALVNGILYVPYGGHYGDCGNYHGWVVAVPVTNATQVSAWATGAYGSGIWAPSGVASDGTNLYVTTGNGMSRPSGLGTAPGTWSGDEAVIRFGSGLGFSQQTSEYFAPANWSALDTADADIGGTGPVLFDLPGSTPSQLTIALGKNGIAYLLNRSNLGGITTALSQIRVSQTVIITAAVAYRTATATYVAFRGRCAMAASMGDVVAIRINPGSPPTMSLAWCGSANGGALGGAPIVTASDSAGTDTIVWGLGAGSGGDQRLHGFDGDTGAVVFAGGGAGDVMSNLQAFQTPIVSNGRIFVAGNTRVFSFSIR